MKKKFLSVLLSVSMLMTMGGVSALAATGIAAKEETTAETAAEKNLLRMWYDEPASASGLTGNDLWEQMTLPIGNSFMGANVYGEIVNERYALFYVRVQLSVSLSVVGYSQNKVCRHSVIFAQRCQCVCRRFAYSTLPLRYRCLSYR